MPLQPSLSDPLHCRETRHCGTIHKKKGKLRGTAPYVSIPPHNFKAYQLYTLYRAKDGKIMQVSDYHYHVFANTEGASLAQVRCC